MDKELLEVVLKKSANDSKMMRIVDMKIESALPKGENYTSTIFRITLKMNLGNGRTATKSCILKKETISKGSESLFQGYSITKTEASIYTDVLQNMERLIEEFGDTEGPLWCKLIYSSCADSIIVLEDLKPLGFSTVKRTQVQDMEHARLAIRNIGRYHAMAKVVEERGLISKDKYKSCPLLYNEMIAKHVIFGGIQALIKGMRRTWGEEWTKTADELSQISFNDLWKKIQSNVDFDDKVFKCLNHGDCWNNNMMFRHNWEGRPIEMRLIDFQGPHHNTPCIDLVYFIFTSVQPHLRRQHFNSLVQHYHESLVTYLERYGYKGPKPSLEEIRDTVERLKYFGLALFIGSFPIEIYSGTDGFDVIKLFQTGGEEGYNLNIYSEDGVIEKIGEDIKTFIKVMSN